MLIVKTPRTLRKTLLIICALLFSIGMHGQDSIQTQFAERVHEEIEGKKYDEAKVAFNQMLSELDFGRVTLNGTTREISETDVKECQKKAFTQYVSIFIRYANEQIEKGSNLASINEEAERLLSLNIAEKNGKTEKGLKRIIRESSPDPSHHETSQPGGTPSVDPRIARLTQRRDQLKRDTASFGAANRQLQREIAELESSTSGRNSRARTEANAKAKEWENKYNRLKKALSARDVVLWKECLLYPLTCRFDQKRIDNALAVVSSYSELGYASSDFKKYQTTYVPMLQQYKQFNNEVITHLQDRIAAVETKQRTLGNRPLSIDYDYWESLLEKLPYYSYYKDRNNDPWKSIQYLDERIDEYKALMKKKPTDAEALKQALQGIINKLQPRQ